MNATLHNTRGIQRQALAARDARSQLRGIIEKPLGDMFPWDKCQFGLRISGTNVLVNAGSVVKLTYTPLDVAAATVAIGATETYVHIRVARDLSVATILGITTVPVSDNDYVRLWFASYKVVNGICILQKLNLGQMMNVDISAYGD
jgi:hypothetical protein